MVTFNYDNWKWFTVTKVRAGMLQTMCPLDLSDNNISYSWDMKQGVHHRPLFFSPQIELKLATQAPEMYPGFQIMGSSGPRLEKFGGSLQSFGGPANL